MDIEIGIGDRVLFPGRHFDPDEVGMVKDVFTQPSIDLNDGPKDHAIFFSEDECPDEDGNYPTTTLRPKTLCVVEFSICVQVIECKDLVKVDEHNRKVS